MEGAIKWLRQIVYGNPLFYFWGLGHGFEREPCIIFLGGSQRTQFETANNFKSLTRRKLGTNHLCDAERAPSQLLEAEGCIDSRFHIQTLRGPLKTQRQQQSETLHRSAPSHPEPSKPIKENTKTEQSELLHRSVLSHP